MSRVGVVLVGRARGPESLPRCVCRAPVLGRVPRGPGFRPELRATSGECALGSTSAGCVTPAGQGGCEVTERARERALRRAARGWPRRLPRLCLAWPRACRARCRRRPPAGSGAAPQEAAGFDAQTALASRNSEDVGFYPQSDSLAVTRVRGKAGSESWLALGQGGSRLLRRPRDPSGGPRAMTGKSPGGGRVLVVR